jgi:hypothetical protein
MNEASYEQTQQAMGGSAGDETLLVRFYLEPMQDQAKTAEEGRPIFTDTPFISIMQPGNKDSVVIRPASEMDKARFPRHWSAFNDRQIEELVEGTPLSEWPAMTRSMVEELKFKNVSTIEQLIGMSDTNTHGFMGINALKEKARKYLSMSSSEAAAEAVIRAEKRVAELESQVKELVALAAQTPEPKVTTAEPLPDIAAMIAQGIAAAMATVEPKPKRKRRTPAEMAAAKAEEQPKTE